MQNLGSPNKLPVINMIKKRFTKVCDVQADCAACAYCAGPVADPRGANPAMAPIEVGNGVWPPLGGRKSNDSTVNMCKSKDFGPLFDVGYGFGPPLRKKIPL